MTTTTPSLFAGELPEGWTLTSPPIAVTIKARDVLPCRYAIWCTINGGNKFLNEIATRRLDADGRICFMLDSFNFMWKYPDELVEVVPITRKLSAELQAWIDADDAKNMSETTLTPEPKS